jgi:hypothetical protein
MLRQVHGCPTLRLPEAQDARPAGVIVVAPSAADTYLYEHEGTALTTADVADFARIRRQPEEEPPHSTKGNPAAAFRPANDKNMA